LHLARFTRKQRELGRFGGDGERGRQVQLEGADQRDSPAVGFAGRGHIDAVFGEVRKNPRVNHPDHLLAFASRIGELGIHAGAAFRLVPELAADRIETDRPIVPGNAGRDDRHLGLLITGKDDRRFWQFKCERTLRRDLQGEGDPQLTEGNRF